jgi:hypothetical protein
MHENALTLVLFEKKRVTLRYAYQATDALNLTGPTVNTGEITLEPMEEGSYRPPARAFFSFKQNKYVGSSGVLDIGIAADERNGTVLFGGCEGRFDHFTDLGRIPFDDVVLVDTNKLDRRRENTPMKEGHTYIYESNIYPPDQRTQWTGFGVHYGKVLVERIESLPSGGLP